MTAQTPPREDGTDSQHKDKIGTVRVAPEVLATIAGLTAQAVPGVVRLGGRLTDEVGKLFGRGRSSHGIKVTVVNNEVWVELHLVVKPDISMYQVARQVQDDVAQALETMVGMPVHAVDVYIEDVE